MSLIDTSYFVSELSLPVGKDSNLENDINRYEPEILRRLLGYELAKEVLAYDSQTAAQPLVDLVEGVEYDVEYEDGIVHTIKWEGLINDNKKSLIANYVYFKWQKNSLTRTARVGEVKSKQQHSTAAAVHMKISQAWGDMLTMYGYYGQDDLTPSAYNFLDTNSDDYPKWLFKAIGSVNSMDL